MIKNEKVIYVGCETSNKPVLLKYQKSNGRENALILSSVGQGQYSNKDNIAKTDS